MTEIPEAIKKKTRKFSPVWLTPILALAITVWLIYNGYVNSGKEIRIRFDSGSDIVVGKTLVKYRGIPVGKVIDLEIADTLDKVDAVIKLDKRADAIAREGMRFWIVKPRISINQITGLETIMSGTYIEMAPPFYDKEELAKLKETNFFIGLSEPADLETEKDAVNVNLFSVKDMGIYSGMGVYFNGISAGRVLGVRYDRETNKYNVSVSVSKEYQKYINKHTKFWNVGGIDMRLDSAGFSLQVPQFNSLLQGGVAFDSDIQTDTAQPEESYEVFSSYSSTLLSPETVTLYMPECYGMKDGRTPVMFKGVQAGIVDSLDINDKQQCVASIKLNRKFGYLAAHNSRFVLEQPEISLGGVKNISSALLGVYIQVESGGGAVRREFTLSDRPIITVPEGSFRLTLKADSRAVSDEGEGIYYKGVKIGMVTSVSLRNSLTLYGAVIFPEYKKLAVTGLYLYKPDLFKMSYASGQLRVDTEPGALTRGGISAGFFGAQGSPLKEGAALTLYSDEDSARRADISSGGLTQVSLKTSDAFGLGSGSPVYFKGVQAGEIASVDVSSDGSVDVRAVIYPGRVKKDSGMIFWKNGVMSADLSANGLEMQAPTLQEAFSGGLSFDVTAEGAKSSYHIYDSRLEAERVIRRLNAGKTVRLYYNDVVPPEEDSPVYFNGIKTGFSSAAGYDKKLNTSYVDILIDKKYAGTVGQFTRFYNAGIASVGVKGGAIEVHAEPFMNYVSGAVYYETFASSGGADRLYADRKSAEAPDHLGIYVYLNGTVSLKEGADVVCDGRKVGYISRINDRGGKKRAYALIYRENSGLLSEGAVLWTEDIEISLDGIKNADSALFGTKLAMKGGNGKPKTEFTLSDKYMAMDGLRIVVTADSRNSLEQGSPVYYRQVQVGEVESVKLSDDAKSVEIKVFIQKKHAPLVRTSSVFTAVSGVDASYGIFKGVRIKTGTVKSMIKGGLEFTTDESKGEPMKDGGTIALTK
ncbi:MAG: MlaD family protein [Deferribacterales bacterium]